MWCYRRTPLGSPPSPDQSAASLCCSSVEVRRFPAREEQPPVREPGGPLELAVARLARGSPPSVAPGTARAVRGESALRLRAGRGWTDSCGLLSPGCCIGLGHVAERPRRRSDGRLIRERLGSLLFARRSGCLLVVCRRLLPRRFPRLLRDSAPGQTAFSIERGHRGLLLVACCHERSSLPLEGLAASDDRPDQPPAA